MKYVISLIKSVISPIIVFFIPIIGLMASLMSFLIEVLVVEQLLTLLPGTESIFGKNLEVIRSLVAIFVVFVLEMQKLSGSFVLPCLVPNNDIPDYSEKAKIRNLNKHGTALKYMLLVFSVVCTVLYSTYCLYGAVSDNTSTINTRQNEYRERMEQELDERYQQYVQNMNALEDMDAWVREYIADDLQYQNAKKQYDDAENAHNREINRSQIYFSKEKEESLRQMRDDAETRLNDIYAALRIQAETAYYSTVANTTSKYSDDLETITEKYESREINIIKTNSSGDNPYIKAFLSVIFNIAGRAYPEWVYRILVILIASVIAAALELIIIYTQNFTSLQQSTLEKLLSEEETEYLKQVKGNMQSLLDAVLIAITCAAVYVFSRIIIVTIWGAFSSSLRDEIVTTSSIISGKNIASITISYMIGRSATPKLISNARLKDSFLLSTISTLLISGAFYFLFGLIVSPNGQVTFEEYMINLGSIFSGSAFGSVKNRKQSNSQNNNMSDPNNTKNTSAV